MGEWIGKDRKARRCYGFDEIALVPGSVTLNPDEVDISWEINGKKFPIPFLASAMDGVVDPKFAIAMGNSVRLQSLTLKAFIPAMMTMNPSSMTFLRLPQRKQPSLFKNYILSRLKKN